MEKKFKIQKIPLENLIAALDKLWQEGADFADMDVSLSSVRDRIDVSAKDEYYTAIPLSFIFSREGYEELIYLGTNGSEKE